MAIQSHTHRLSQRPALNCPAPGAVRNDGTTVPGSLPEGTLALTRPALLWRRPSWRGIGPRLLLLLLIAEAPLVLFTIGLAIQNDGLRASDAVSHIQAAQTQALSRLASNLAAARALAQAAASLPPALLADPSECAGVLATIAAAGQARVAGVVVANGTGTRVCGAAPAAAAPGQTWLIPTRSGLSIVRNLAPSQTGEVTVHLAGTPPASPTVWLAPLHGAWLPIDATSPPSAQPAQPFGCGDCQRRARSRDGRLFLYTAIALPPGIGNPGARLIAASDIAAASIATARGVVARVLELALFFIVEFLLIAGGVALVAARPLARLNQAVAGWRQDGRFGLPNTAGAPLEVTELTQSFEEATRSLESREQELRSAIARQDQLMQEIHHRVKNNLQIVASLLNLQAARIKAPEARAEFQSARDRVRALATLHRHLYATGDVHNIDMRAFFAELCSQLFQANNEVEGDRIALDIQAPDVGISSDQAVPIALIVTETVGNALKYAFPDRRAGRIEVHFTVVDDRHATLTVRDNGVGIADRPEANDGGLGLQLVRGFARQLNAELSITTTAGTCYRLAMQIERDRQNTIAFGRAAAV